MKRCVACDAALLAQAWTCASCSYTPRNEGSYLSFLPKAVAEENFEAAFFSVLRQLEPGFWWFEARNAIIIWALGKWGNSRGSFFEIGAGTGFVSAGIARRFPDMTITASELFPEGLPIIAERLPAANLLQLDALRLPFRNEFDAIGAFDVIEHIEEDVAVLIEARKALKPQGILLITVPQHQFLWSNNDVNAHHKRRYGRRELVAKLRQAGFDILAVRSFVSLLFPLLLASRLSRGQSDEYDETAQYRISPAVNNVLRAIMHVELALIRGRCPFLFGGSLLAVARPHPEG